MARSNASLLLWERFLFRSAAVLPPYCWSKISSKLVGRQPKTLAASSVSAKEFLSSFGRSDEATWLGMAGSSMASRSSAAESPSAEGFPAAAAAVVSEGERKRRKSTHVCRKSRRLEALAARSSSARELMWLCSASLRDPPAALLLCCGGGSLRLLSAFFWAPLAFAEADSCCSLRMAVSFPAKSAANPSVAPAAAAAARPSQDSTRWRRRCLLLFMMPCFRP
mmetsp:Transcript_11638/g.29437  ORF Transcript_11638/g.29437 Transcript_11638/m.29437 type:complete len:223 (+) Transcript_11638:134-802(+)